MIVLTSATLHGTIRVYYQTSTHFPFRVTRRREFIRLLFLRLEFLSIRMGFFVWILSEDDYISSSKPSIQPCSLRAVLFHNETSDIRNYVTRNVCVCVSRKPTRQGTQYVSGGPHRFSRHRCELFAMRRLLYLYRRPVKPTVLCVGAV